MQKASLPKLAAIAVIIGALAGSARGQQQEDAEAARAEAQEESIAEAQIELEAARQDLEEAARRVAELSGSLPAFPPFPPLPALPGMGPRAVLGVVIEDGDDGVHVTGVTPSGAAAKAGVAVGDVITAIDTVTLTGSGSESQRLVEHMAEVEPGQEIELRVLRGGDARNITVTAREPEDFFVFAGEPGQAGQRIIMRGGPSIAVTPGTTTWVGPGMQFNRFWGGRWNELELVSLTDGLGSYFGTTEGLLVVRAPNDDTVGLQDGDVILEIGGRAPASPEHAMRILMSFDRGETIEFSIMRRQRREAIEYTIPGDPTRG